jgi:hypothetical protein
MKTIQQNIPTRTYTRDIMRMAKLICKLNKQEEITVYVYTGGLFSLEYVDGFKKELKFYKQKRNQIIEELTK